MKEPPTEERHLMLGSSDRIELVATVIMSLAAIFTAWAAFESAKWGGEQAIEFSAASAARTESIRYDTQAGQQQAVDIALFTNWLNAISADADAGLVDISPGASLQPVEGTLSGFLFERFRPEFMPAMEAWLVLFSEERSEAPPSPFVMDEYVLAAADKSDELLDEAEVHAQTARDDNKNSDDYVLTVVAFALVLFFGGISSKLKARRNRMITIILASIIFAGASIALFSLPKIVPF